MMRRVMMGYRCEMEGACMLDSQVSGLLTGLQGELYLCIAFIISVSIKIEAVYGAIQ